MAQIPNTGFMMQQRSGDQNQIDSQAQQQMVAMLLKNALAAPQRPELSWTQGLARMLESGVSAYTQQALNNKNQQIQQTQGNDAKILGMALASNDPKQIALAMQQMKDPQSQNMALNALAASQGANQARSLEMDKIGLQNQGKTDVANINKNTPDNIAKQKNAELTQYQAAVQNQIAQQTDPAKKAALQNTLSQIQQNQSLLINQTRANKGDLPDVIGADKNAYIQKLDNGQVPLAGEAASYQHGKMTDGPEKAMQQQIGKAAGDSITQQAKTLQAQADSSQQASRLGDKILQDFANNPNITSGPGTETQTKIVSFFNKLAPGLIRDNSDQQAMQKDLGGFMLAGGQRLHEIGVQRLTQMELQYIVPMFEPTLLNTKAGVKSVIEGMQAIDPIMQQGAQKMQDLYAAYAKNPNFDIGHAVNELNQTVSKEMSNTTMNYFNSKLAQTGQKIIINPDYDPKTNPINKFVKVQMDDNGNPIGVTKGQLNAQDIGADPKLLTPALGQGNPGDQFKPIEGETAPDQTQQPGQPQNNQPPAQNPQTTGNGNQPNAPQQSPIAQPQGNPTPPPQAPDVSQSQAFTQNPASANPQDVSQQIKPDVPPQQNVSYQQPDPSQSILAPQGGAMPIGQQQNPMDQQQMLAMALANKQPNPQMPDYSSQFANNPNMSF